MAEHIKVYGFCDNKCRREVVSKEEFNEKMGGIRLHTSGLVGMTLKKWVLSDETPQAGTNITGFTGFASAPELNLEISPTNAEYSIGAGRSALFLIDPTTSSWWNEGTNFLLNVVPGENYDFYFANFDMTLRHDVSVYTGLQNFYLYVRNFTEHDLRFTLAHLELVRLQTL